MIKTNYEINKNCDISSYMFFSNSIIQSATDISSVVNMLDFRGIDIVHIAIESKKLFKKNSLIVVDLKTFEDVVEFCKKNEELNVDMVVRDKNRLNIYINI